MRNADNQQQSDCYTLCLNKSSNAIARAILNTVRQQNVMSLTQARENLSKTCLTCFLAQVFFLCNFRAPNRTRLFRASLCKNLYELASKFDARNVRTAMRPSNFLRGCLPVALYSPMVSVSASLAYVTKATEFGKAVT